MIITEHGLPLVKSPAGELGWRDLSRRDNNRSAELPTPKVTRSLLNLIHISDTHICDAQSPARVEYLDRYADPHHPVSVLIGSLVGTYRAQEILTTQVLESMVQSANKITRAPISGGPIDAVIITGDLTDNAQFNELDWFLTLINGGKICPDSGSEDKWEGPGGDHYSPFFWNPHGTPKGEVDDFPRRLYGFPTVPELLDAIRAPFQASGLTHKWLAVHGNHDALLQGTVAPDALLREIAISGIKIFELSDEEALESLRRVSEIGPAQYPAPLAPTNVSVTPDLMRDFVEDSTWQERFATSDQPFIRVDQGDAIGVKYWRKDFELVTLIALDTVNPFGGWQGSIDQLQFEWLKTQVESARDRFIVITSHHPLQDMTNSYTPFLSARVTGTEIKEFLILHTHVVAWVCGHSHRHKVIYQGADKEHGFWQIETASLIDWPQQGRIIEFFLDEQQEFTIASSPLDHEGDVAIDFTEININDVNTLSGISRVLSLNDWQRREGAFIIEDNEGVLADRSFLITMQGRVAR